VVYGNEQGHLHAVGHRQRLELVRQDRYLAGRIGVIVEI